jgi:hypothetical protein
MTIRFAILAGALLASACDSATAPRNDLVDEPLEVALDAGWEWADLGTACVADAPATPLSAARRDSLPVREPGSWTIDDTYADLALRVPGGWAGWYVSGDETIVYLVDPASLTATLDALAAEGVRAPSHPPVARPARWDFAQLHDWYRYLLLKLSAAGGIRSSDIQEARNRLQFGLTDAAAVAQFDARLRELGVPCHLVVRKVVQPIQIY